MGNGLGDYVTQQTTLEYQRKSSIETKCYSTLTACLALVTLYIALSNQPDLAANLQRSLPRSFLLVALISGVVSVLLALIAARPLTYPAVHADDLEETRKTILAGDLTEAEAENEIIEAQIRDLRTARAANSQRATLLFASLTFLGIETAGLIVSLSVATAY